MSIPETNALTTDPTFPQPTIEEEIKDTEQEIKNLETRVTALHERLTIELQPYNTRPRQMDSMYRERDVCCELLNEYNTRLTTADKKLASLRTQLQTQQKPPSA